MNGKSVDEVIHLLYVDLNVVCKWRHIDSFIVEVETALCNQFGSDLKWLYQPKDNNNERNLLINILGNWNLTWNPIKQLVTINNQRLH